MVASIGVIGEYDPWIGPGGAELVDQMDEIRKVYNISITNKVIAPI